MQAQPLKTYPQLTSSQNSPANKCLLSKRWCTYVCQQSSLHSCAEILWLLTVSNNQIVKGLSERGPSETDRRTPAFSSWQAVETCGRSHSDVFSVWNTSTAFFPAIHFWVFGLSSDHHSALNVWIKAKELKASWVSLGRRWTFLSIRCVSSTFSDRKQTHKHRSHTQTYTHTVRDADRGGGFRWVASGNLDRWQGTVSKQLIKCY